MPVDDLRVAAWSVRSTVGSTRTLVSTWTDADGAPFDLDGHTVALLVGDDEMDIDADGNVATITLVTPDDLATVDLLFRLDGEDITRGSLIPSERGTDDGDLTLDVNVAPIQIAMTVIGGAAGGGAPSGPAGGDLTGTYPNPTFAVAVATQAALTSEAATRAAADTALDGRLDLIEAVGPLASSASVTAAVLVETNARIADVNAEEAARIAADGALDGRLDTIEAISIATDAELSAAVAAEAALARNADNLTSGTVNILRLPATVATDTEVTNAVAAEVIARDAAIAQAVADLIGSAPGLLDTLQEIADALGDDPNFAATMTTALAGKQPLDADLTSIAALTTTAYGRSVLELANASAGRTLLGLIIGTDVQAFSAVLAATTASFTTADETKLDALPSAATYASDLAGKQPVDADLTALAAANNSAVLAATTASFLTADETKLDALPSAATLASDLAAKAADADVVHDTGAETIAGVKTFSSDPVIPDEAYGAGWNGSLEPPTKNAVYDKIETIGGGWVATAYKTAIQTIQSQIVQQDVTGLLFAIGVNEVWAGEFVLFTSGTSAGDYDFAITVPAAFDILRYNAFGPRPGGTSDAVVTMGGTAIASAAEVALGALNVGNGSLHVVKFFIDNGANAGNLQLQFAQAASTAVDTSILAGSYGIAHRLA